MTLTTIESPEIQESPDRRSLNAGDNRFSSNNFKFFELSVQSSLHLSLAVLVRYRSPTVYLALGGVYHPDSNRTLKRFDSTTFIHFWIHERIHPPFGSILHGDFTLCVFKAPFQVTWDR